MPTGLRRVAASSKPQTHRGTPHHAVRRQPQRRLRATRAPTLRLALQSRLLAHPQSSRSRRPRARDLHQVPPRLRLLPARHQLQGLDLPHPPQHLPHNTRGHRHLHHPPPRTPHADPPDHPRTPTKHQPSTRQTTATPPPAAPAPSAPSHPRASKPPPPAPANASPRYPTPSPASPPNSMHSKRRPNRSCKPRQREPHASTPCHLSAPQRGRPSPRPSSLPSHCSAVVSSIKPTPSPPSFSTST